MSSFWSLRFCFCQFTNQTLYAIGCLVLSASTLQSHSPLMDHSYYLATERKWLRPHPLSVDGCLSSQGTNTCTILTPIILRSCPIQCGRAPRQYRAATDRSFVRLCTCALFRKTIQESTFAREVILDKDVSIAPNSLAEPLVAFEIVSQLKACSIYSVLFGSAQR